jgi:DNA-3-methyladenine glycosylase
VSFARRGAFGPILPRAFFARDAVSAARALLGKILVRTTSEGVVAGRIVETEAYRGPTDRAAHSYGGRRTSRNESMWGKPGLAYVYFVYGMHWCANVVCAAVGVPEAVLLRAVEPIDGVDLMRRRRGVDRRGRAIASIAKTPDARLASGPANLCRAFAIDGRDDGVDLAARASQGLVLRDAPDIPRRAIEASPRIGVAYAGPDARRLWRFTLRGSPSLSS